MAFNVQKLPFAPSPFEKSPYHGRGTAPSQALPLGNFAPSLCPRLTNPGIAIRGYKGPGPPPPPLIGETKQKLKNWGLISLLMCRKCFFYTQIFKKNLPTVVPHPSPARSLRSLALAPLLKNPGYASDHILYVSLYISRYPSVRNTHFP